MRPYRELQAEPMAQLACERLQLAVTDRDEFVRLISAGMDFRRFPHAENRLKLLKSLNLISLEVFEALISGGASYNSGPIRYLWDCMERAGVVVPTMGSFTTGYATHNLFIERIAQLSNANALINAFRPPYLLHEYYSDALIAIDVLKDGNPYRGSGFIIPTVDGHAVLTCRHNIDPEAGITEIELTSSSGKKIPFKNFILSNNIDAAIIILQDDHNIPIDIRFSLDIETFDEVYTLGFPYIPGAHPTLVGHRGEVNGRAEVYLDKSPALLISNLVSPGSSGCPVLTRDGFCVGMTTRWLEASAEQGGARFSAAIPADALLKFVTNPHA